MESLLNIPEPNKESIRILQITDMHLFGTKDQTLLGINTWDSYDAVITAILNEGKAIDLIAATGDLSQDHSIDAYHHFVEGISRLPAPCVWLPGNHDFQPVMFDTLEQAGISPCKQVLIGNNWQVLLLDSQVFGVPHGELSDYQLEWMTDKLKATPERHTLVLLHHHPLPAGCSWLDQHGLRNSHAFEVVLQNYPQVKTLICGHIHQELDLDWNGLRILATPSTCIQFKPHSANFALDTIEPGWRWLELYPDGSIMTEVCRLSGSAFTPDTESEGY